VAGSKKLMIEGLEHASSNWEDKIESLPTKQKKRMAFEGGWNKRNK